MSPEMKFYLSAIINLIIFVITMLIFLSYFRNGEGSLTKPGVRRLRYYTTLSNVFSGLVCGATFLVELTQCFRCGIAIPHFLVLLKYMSTSAVTLTFITVLFYLGPMKGYGIMYSGTSMFTHLIGPLLAIISFCFLENTDRISGTEVFVGIMPTLAYALMYIRQVIYAQERSETGELTRGWEDFYGFQRNGHYIIPFFIMMIAASIACFVIRLIYNMKVGF